MIKKLGTNISKENKSAFLSGIVYADIGRFKFDKETGVESDSDKFVTEIRKFAKTDEEKWFVRGFETYIFQDGKTKEFMKDALGREYSSYITYALNCATLDSYFMKKTDILYNEYLIKFDLEQAIDGLDNSGELSNELDKTRKEKLKKYAIDTLNIHSKDSKKNELVIYEELIQKTYASFGFNKISLDEIHKQAGNLLGAFIVFSTFVGSKIPISEELAQNIEQASDKFADSCISKNEELKKYVTDTLDTH